MRPYTTPARSSIKTSGCFENKPVTRVEEVLNVVGYKVDKHYREITIIVNEKGTIKFIELRSLAECILVSDLSMIGIITTIFSDRVIEKKGKKVIPFSMLSEICDAIYNRKVAVHAKNRSVNVSTMTENSYILHVNTFPIVEIKKLISDVNGHIQNAGARDEQQVKALVRALIIGLQHQIGD